MNKSQSQSGFISDSSKSMLGRSQARRVKGRKKFQTYGT